MVDTLTNTIYAQLNIRYDNTKNRVAGYDVSIDGNTKSMDYIYGELSRAPDVINGVKQNGTRILSYDYDSFNRLKKRTLATTTPYVTEYTYYQGATIDKTTTPRIFYGVFICIDLGERNFKTKFRIMLKNIEL